MVPVATLRQMCGTCWAQHVAGEPVARLWRRDHTLWKHDPTEITNRLGWLDLPFQMRAASTDLAPFVFEMQRRATRDVVLLGMGGSSLCAEVLRLAFPRRDGAPALHVLDSTVPETVARVAAAIDPARALFLVSSKSGGTIEVMSLYRFFSARLRAAGVANVGEHFVAITDPGTSLEKLAKDEGFARTFINPPDVGGRYSVLSYFGLVPAALLGVEVGEFLARAREMARLCGVETPIEENPGAWLGLVSGCLAINGRDKLTLITSPALAGFGLWAEQLIAESTGKEGKGIVPIAGEPFAAPGAYGPDRVFVYLRLQEDDNAASDRHAHALAEAGFPVLSSDLKDVYDLGGEFFKWEFATALAGRCLAINPFDQPNVEEAKRGARQVIQEYEKTHALPRLQDEGTFGDLLKSARPGDYLALMAFVDETPELDQAMHALRERLLLKRKLPTTLGYGPRFLHSTGQLHKGGADNGLFVQITADPGVDLSVPGSAYDFGALAAAQALGDLAALRVNRRRVIRVHVPKGGDVAARVLTLAGEV